MNEPVEILGLIVGWAVVTVFILIVMDQLGVF
jgi:hypothetical protein